MAFNIEWATENDVVDILAFIRELAIYEKLERDVVASPEALRATLFSDKKYAEVVFVREGTLRIGFALFFHNYSTFLAKPGLYLEDLFIRESHRGKGYGKKVFSFLSQLALERGCGRLDWAVLDWNEPAIQMYLKLGAKPNSEWTGYRLGESEMRSLLSREGV